VITGDMLHHPIQFIDPQRHGNFDMDKDEGGRTRQQFVDRFADAKTLIIGSHFPEPTSGWIVRDGKAWKLRTE
jgi:glyoxylase-like metal-dependent hydrolase (beta-lactamase superfamily II)